MRQVCILVEGQTEEAVVKTLLIDAAKARDIYLIPIIVRTSLTQRGFPGEAAPGSTTTGSSTTYCRSPTGTSSAL